MKLPRLSNAQYEEVEIRATMSNVPLDQCPTCGSKTFIARNEDQPDLGEARGRSYGTYRYRGEECACDCETQMLLRKHYLLANIGDQYFRLDWQDYRDPEVKDNVALYLDRWESFKVNGMGMEFGGAALGVGKTFGATYVGKELIKRGERVFFLPFMELISVYQLPPEERERMHRRLREVTVLILDEVRPPYSAAQEWLFAERFEELIRHRTNFNLPTIIGTNLTDAELGKHYPRTYSLLEAKQWRLELTGQDARQSWIAMENIDLAANGEVRPIT